MKPEHKEYILNNIINKSIKEISRELGIKERKIKSFLNHQKLKKEQLRISFPKTETTIKKKHILFSVFLIIVLGFAVYSNSLGGEFLWDDRYLVKENIHIRDWSNLEQVFTRDIGAGAGRKYNFYRPIQICTYMVDYSFWKMNPRGYHLTNILLHISVALALFWFINLLFQNRHLSLIASSLFVVHPIHTEVVSYISGRSDSLSALFMILCCIFYIKQLTLKNISIFMLMVASYALALLSRESSLILPAALLLYHFTFQKKIKPAFFCPLLALSFIYVILRLTVLKFTTPEAAQVSTVLLERLPGFFVVLFKYIQLLFLPFNLHMEYGGKLFAFSDPKAIFGILIFVILVIVAFRKREENNLVMFSVLWFFSNVITCI